MSLGNELVVNGGFSIGDNWELPPTGEWYIGGGLLNFQPFAYSETYWEASQAIGITGGKTYQVDFDFPILQTMFGMYKVSLGGNEEFIGMELELELPKVFTAGSSDNKIKFLARGYDEEDVLVAIDNVSVREILDDGSLGLEMLEMMEDF